MGFLQRPSKRNAKPGGAGVVTIFVSCIRTQRGALEGRTSASRTHTYRRTKRNKRTFNVREVHLGDGSGLLPNSQ